MNANKTPFSRRDFLKTSSAISAAVLLTGSHKAFAAGSDTLRVGLIGCGGRGLGAAIDCAQAAPGVQIVALADLFKDDVDSTLAHLQKDLAEKNCADAFKVTPDKCFFGFDAYQKVLACDIDLVILATPPHFRPAHFKAAVEAGKHVFMEKPVAVDPVGVRSILESAAIADQKKLCVVAGTQRRHSPGYNEIIKRVHNGDIGDIVAANCYWNMGDLWVERARKNMENRLKFGWSDMEWQCKNWLFLTWLSGDHIVEQHVHNLDIINWAMQATPVSCMGMGGRQVRTGPEFGNVFDHFSVEYKYPNGARVLSMCRQTAGCSDRISEWLVGTKGFSNPKESIEGPNAYDYKAPENEASPYVLEHKDLITAIRSGNTLNEGKQVAHSTLTAIMGRMSAYTGRELKWDWALNASKLDLTPPAYEFGPLPVEPVAVPGQTPLV